MSAQDTAIRRFAAAEVLSAFYFHLDRGDYAGCLDCFASDATWIRLGAPLVGRDAIAAGLEARDPALLVRHVLTNLHVTLAGEGAASGAATAHAYVTVYTHRFPEAAYTLPAPMDPPIALYAITATLGETTDGWKISHLTMAAQLYSPRPAKLG